MTIEQRPEGVSVENPKTEADVIAEQGYVISPRLMRVSSVGFDGHPIYDALDSTRHFQEPAMPEMTDGRFLEWMYLGLIESPLTDPLDLGVSRKVGVYLFYDPERIQTVSEYDLDNESATLDGEEWLRREEKWRQQGWAVLDRGPIEHPTNPAVIDWGRWFIRRTPQVQSAES